MNLPEIKPCPFCGGTATLQNTSRWGWCVSCAVCEATIKKFVLRETVEQVKLDIIEKWNSRALIINL